MRVHLVRHFAPDVAPGVCYGSADLAVSDEVHARMLSSVQAALPSNLPVYSSPLQRCLRLARALACDVRVDQRLAELDFGAWELRRWSDIARAEVDAWAADVAHYRPGGADSVATMALRVHAFYEQLMRSEEPECVIVCHAGTMRLFAARQLGLAPAAMAQHAASHAHAIGYGAVVTLDCV
ncbi:histidine phosphatase family protein [Massilia sp. GCM10020059]|uniref:Histidine phosphatase family protein n=1 Tax=Massilia agrisoli TaxID=2892444 RepID=A0ABS8IWK4_9BURK|nr:histidine phosphatase family protein [Massilia agrisoli]MCC6072533.1 histidine phosphatase family protein [Massilia agrisoli]